MKNLLECEINTAVIPVPEPSASDDAWIPTAVDSGPLIRFCGVRQWSGGSISRRRIKPIAHRVLSC